MTTTREGHRVSAYFWTNDDHDQDPYVAGDVLIGYDPECSGDFDGVAFHVGDGSFTVSLPDLLEAIAMELRK